MKNKKTTTDDIVFYETTGPEMGQLGCQREDLKSNLEAALRLACQGKLSALWKNDKGTEIDLRPWNTREAIKRSLGW